MLALTPLNTAALNSVAVSPLVSVAAAGAVTASATLSGSRRIRGLRAAATASTTVSTSFARLVAASALVAVSAGATAATSRGMVSVAAVTAHGVGSIPSVEQLHSEVSVTVSAAALIGGKFLASGVTVSAQAADSATRTRSTLATATASCTQTAALAKRADFYVSSVASAVSTPVDVDTITGGVRTAALSAQPTVGVAATGVLLRTGLLSTSALASAQAVSTVSRWRPCAGAVTALAGQTSNLTVQRPDGALGLASVTAQASAFRTAGLRAGSLVSTRVNAARVVLAPAALRSSEIVTAVASTAPFDRTRGLVSTQFVLTSATADLRVQTPELLFAAAAATVTTQVTLAVSAEWSSQVSVAVSGVGDLRTNIFDDEPDYRSFVVPRQEFAFLVPRQEFTAYISSDVQPLLNSLQSVSPTTSSFWSGSRIWRVTTSRPHRSR